MDQLQQHNRERVRRGDFSRNPHSTKGAGGQSNAGLKEWMKKDGWAAIGIVLLLTIAAWILIFRADRYMVTAIEVAETQFIPVGRIAESAEQFRASKAFGLIPRDSFWTIRGKSLERHITKQLEADVALRGVSVEKKLPSTVRVSVEERVPSFTWVTKDTSDQEHFYEVDINGVVTRVVPTFDEVNKSLPRVRDDNRGELGVGWHIVSQSYLDFVVLLRDQFEATVGLPADSFIMPLTSCFERQFVTEEIFEREILESESEEFRNRKIEIQEQFQRGELTIDQSLEALEQVKESELQKLSGDDGSDNGIERLEWRSTIVPIECDYVAIAQDIRVATGGERSFEVWFDKNVDPATQMENARATLQQQEINRDGIEYVDVRLPDRAYYR